MSNQKSKTKGIFTMLPIVFTLAWPTMLEQLMQTAVQYIDTAMVGTLGTSATAAVGATTTVNWLIGSTVSAVGIGFLSYISQALGAGEKERARSACAQAVITVLMIGSLFTALTVLLSGTIPVWMQVDENIRADAQVYFLILYTPMLLRTASIIFGTVLRAAGDTKTPMRVGIIVNIVNVLLNFCLIYPTRTVTVFNTHATLYGAGMGIRGAAAASAVAYAVGGILITYRLWTHKDISPKGYSFKPDMKVLKPCFRVAVPNMLQRFATSLGYVAFASMINSLGEISTAAHTIANTVESAFYIPGWGMQTAAATLAGNAWGAGDQRMLRELTRSVLVLEIALMIISGGSLYIFAPQLMTLFSKEAAVISLGTTVLRMVAVSEPFYGVPIVIEGVMQGMGKTLAMFIYNVLCMWCIRIAGTFLCIRYFSGGLISAWGCMIAHNMLLFVLFSVHYFITERRLTYN